MTVETTVNRWQYDTNGTTGPWTVGAYFLADEDLAVTHTDADGVDTPLALSVDYTVIGAATPDGGTVTTTASYAAGGTITIVNDPEALQESAYLDTDPFPAATAMRGWDRLTMLVQRLITRVDRSLRVSDSEDGIAVLPKPADRALKAATCDIDGNIVFTAPAEGTAGALAAALLDPDAGGASMVSFRQAGAGAVARFVEDKLREVIDIADYGAVLDGSTDDSDAMDAAIAYAKTRSVAGITSAVGIKIRGDCKLTRSHVIDDDYIIIYGEGRFASTVVVSTAFVVFDFKKGDGSSLLYSGVRSLGIRASSGANLASGAFIRLYNTGEAVIDDIRMQGWYIGIDMVGAARSHISRIGFAQAGRTAGQAFGGIKLSGDATAGGCTGTHITDCEWLSNSAVTAPFEHSIYCKSSDGLYIANCHWTEGENGLTIEPDNSTGNDLISSICIANTYLDACTGHCFSAIGTAAATGKYRDIKAVGCEFRGADSTMIQVGSTSASSKIRLFKLLGCTIRMAQAAALSFTSDNVEGAEVANCDFDDNNLSGNASGHDIIARGDSLTLRGNRHLGGHATNGVCIFVASTATNYTEIAADFRGTARATKRTLNAPASSGWQIIDPLEIETYSTLKGQRADKSTTDATTSTLWSWTLANDEGMTIEADVTAFSLSMDKGTSVKLKGQYYKDGAAAPTLVGSVTTIHSVETDAGFAVALDVSGDDVRVRVTGLAGTTIKWLGTINAQFRG